ncbi:hypothetical protein [Haloechinothrix halophila]|uniref:hypothetical protein n=1 Tax=Haloechinothrix halophila TaxID=1069073 RepID=UPI0012F80207|nr:hypothetical protein [Haloechinothrix halophila]
MLLIGDHNLYEFRSVHKWTDPFAEYVLRSVMRLPAARLVYDLPDFSGWIEYEPFRPGCYSTWTGFSRDEGNGLIPDNLMERAVSDYLAACAGEEVPNASLRDVPEIVSSERMVQSWVEHHLGVNGYIAAVTVAAEGPELGVVIVQPRKVVVISLRLEQRAFPPQVRVYYPDDVQVMSNCRVYVNGEKGSCLVDESEKDSLLVALAEARPSSNSGDIREKKSTVTNGARRRLGIRRPQ